MVVDAEQHGLEHAGFGESALDGEQGGTRKVEIAFSVTVDGSGKSVVWQPLGHVRADYPGAFQEGDVLVGESEILDSVKDASGTGYDAVAAAFGQTAGE